MKYAEELLRGGLTLMVGYYIVPFVPFARWDLFIAFLVAFIVYRLWMLAVGEPENVQEAETGE